MDEVGTFAERLEVQARRLRSDGALGRSAPLIRLFDFLLAQTLAGRTPKEIEIAQDVFHKHGGFDVMLDASVRVYIHRLRRKIEDFYANDGGSGDRLFIPKGEYRLGLIDAAPKPAEPDTVAPGVPPPPRRSLSMRMRIGLAVALLLAVNIAGWIALTRNHADPLDAVTQSAFWQPLARNGQPTVLATGDYYIFGEAPDAMNVARLIREFSINSKDDLAQYLMANPGKVGRYVDMGLHYLPTSTPQALRDILPIVDKASGGKRGQELLISMSQMTPDMLKRANIVYIGYLSGLGMLRDSVFDLSGFQVGSSYDELIDRRTGRHYVSDQGDVMADKAPRRDFAYLASLPGPSGARVLIVGGTRDAAVLQAAEIASDPQQLARIAASAGAAPAFEALYEVRTLDELNLGSKLIVARGLGTPVWSPDQTHQHRFPDQPPPMQ